MCFTLKNKIQKLIDAKDIQLKYTTLNITVNLLSDHQVNMLDIYKDIAIENSIWFIETKKGAPISTQIWELLKVEVLMTKPSFAVARASLVV